MANHMSVLSIFQGLWKGGQLPSTEHLLCSRNFPHVINRHQRQHYEGALRKDSGVGLRELVVCITSPTVSAALDEDPTQVAGETWL